MTTDEPTALRCAPPSRATSPAIVGLIRALAEFEHLTHLLQVTPETLEPHLFGARPVVESVVAEARGRIVAFALFFTNYSTFLAKPGLYLEDLFVEPAERGAGIGAAMLTHLAGLAVARGYGRFEWSVLDWNESAIRFYERMGATVMPDWRICRISRRRARPVRGRAAWLERAVDRYAELHAGFRWQVPGDFNIATVCCTRWARETARRHRDPLRGRARPAPRLQLRRARPRRRSARRSTEEARCRARRPRRADPAAALRDRGRAHRALSPQRGRDAALDAVRPRRARVPHQRQRGAPRDRRRERHRQPARGAAALPAARHRARGRRRRRARATSTGSTRWNASARRSRRKRRVPTMRRS